MSHKLKEYKRLVLQELIKRTNRKFAFKAIKDYKKDFPEFLIKELSVVAATTAIIMGY